MSLAVGPRRPSPAITLISASPDGAFTNTLLGCKGGTARGLAVGYSGGEGEVMGVSFRPSLCSFLLVLSLSYVRVCFLRRFYCKVLVEF